MADTWADHAAALRHLADAVEGAFERSPCRCGGTCRRCAELVDVGERLDELADRAGVMADETRRETA